MFFSIFASCTQIDCQTYAGLRPICLEQIEMKGELLQRTNRNFDRLESDIYRPENVFPEHHHITSEGWPGDKEGRTILGLVLEAQATHRTPRYLNEMILTLPKKLNRKGYLGSVQGDTIDEQQLSGHGWLLRALCEYYQWKHDPNVKIYIQGIINNLALPTIGHHHNYPINPDERVKNTGGMAGSSLNIVNHWKLSSDVGCDFIFMNGLVQAYGLFPSEQLKELIDEMISRFFEMNLIEIKAQTHATLSALLAVVRYYELTGKKELLQEAQKRYQLYWGKAITENYENFNWFERPEWTEPCAIVDSYILAVQLWQYTQNPTYLEDAQLIYYNAISHTQRANGGFGCDNCPGSKDNFLSVKVDEAFWCCTMRGGEGLAKAVQYSYFVQGDTIIIPSFHTSSASFKLAATSVKIDQKTSYPFDNKVILTIDSLKKPIRVNLKFFVPSWIQNPKISINQKSVDFQIKNGFALVSFQVSTGEVIEYSFLMNSGNECLANESHTKPGFVRLFYGPLLLSYEGKVDLVVSSKNELKKEGETSFRIKGTDTQLTPVYHLMDAKVCQSSGYRKQILFRQITE